MLYDYVHNIEAEQSVQFSLKVKSGLLKLIAIEHTKNVLCRGLVLVRHRYCVYTSPENPDNSFCFRDPLLHILMLQIIWNIT